jgi:hypothetical protein
MPLVPYHTGIVVEELDASIEQWEQATGVPWGAAYVGPLQVRTVATDVVSVVQMRLAYSSDLCIELVERRPGTCWEMPDGGVGVHHTGCWSEALEADATRLVGLGWPMVAHGVGEQGEFAVFSYHQVPGQGLFELVAAEARPMLEAMARGE